MRVTFCPINVRSILARIAGGYIGYSRKENPVVERIAASWHSEALLFDRVYLSCSLVPLCLARNAKFATTESQGERDELFQSFGNRAQLNAIF